MARMALLLLPVLAAGLLVAFVDPEASASSAAGSPARIAFVDVGQGDGVVIKVGSTVVVSDAGEFHVDRVEQALRSMGRRRVIDVAILSHPHDDHVKNYIGLLERGWRIKLAVLSESAHWEATRTNRALIELLRERRVKLEFTHRGKAYRWGGATWTVLNPPRAQFTGGARQAANASVVYLLEVNGRQALFTGDVEPNVSALVSGLLRTTVTRPVDVFLATHHGSKHGSTPELLETIRPGALVLSVGAGNRFGHPAPEAVERLQGVGASIWCTARNGTTTVTIGADGRLSWSAAREAIPWWSAESGTQTGTCAGR